MGTKLGPSYACLFMDHLEYCVIEFFTGPVPELYKTYIDDSFGVSSESESVLLDFIYFVQNFHSSVKSLTKCLLSQLNSWTSKSTSNMASSPHQFSANPLIPTLTCISTNLIIFTQKQAFHTLSSSDHKDLAQTTKTFSYSVGKMTEFFVAQGYPT